MRLFNTLKSRLILLFGGLILVATSIGTWLVSDLAVDALRKSTGKNLQEVATQLRDKIDLNLYERYSDLIVASAFARDMLATQGASEVSSLLNTLHSNFPSYAWIGLAAPDGKVLASTGDLLKGVDVSQRPWFIEASEKPFIGDAHEAVLLAKKLENPTSRPLRFVDVAVPLQAEDGSLLGVMGAHLYLDWVASMGESLLTPIEERLQSQFIVADRTGAILIGPEGSTGKMLPAGLLEKARSAGSGYLTTNLPLSQDAEGADDYLVGFSRLSNRSEYEGFSWLVLVSKPAEEAFLPARELENSLIIVGVVIALLLIVSAVLAARWTTRPLLQITREANHLDPENPDTLIKLRDDYQEVRTLSSVLRDLIQSLAEKTRAMNELNTTLEQRVVDRTRELEQTNRQLEATVHTDSLTGLKNRRYYFELGRIAAERAVRSGGPLAAFMFDADHFKKVNDVHGHAVGDRALMHLGELARQAVRDIDILARIGGEEFAVILENTTETGAAEVAERLRAHIESEPLPLEHGELALTVSVGVACLYPDTPSDLDTLLGFADKALYAAKASGRNCVRRYSTLDTSSVVTER